MSWCKFNLDWTKLLMDNIAFPTLEIFLLGKFRVKVNGVLLEEHVWKRRSPKKLIKLLALQPDHRLHREQIIDLLWTEQDCDIAFNSLNKAIHTARRTLEPKLKKGSESMFIQTKSSQVILHSPGKLFIDVEEFERLAHSAIKAEDAEIGKAALGLYQGQLLTEDVYDDWLRVKRETLNLLFRKAANKTAEIYLRGEDHLRALELFKKLCREDPTDERVHQNLMRLYAMTGSKYQALKQYEQCRSALRELDMEPEQETVNLIDLIKEGKIPAVKTGSKRGSPLQSNSLIHQSSDSLKDENPNGFQSANQQKLPEIRQLTFRQGVIQTARFASDRQAVFYSAAWESSGLKTYKINLSNFESQAIGQNGTGIFSVSWEGVLALALEKRFLRGFIAAGTLAQMLPKEIFTEKILEDVQWADWHPAGNCITQAFARQYLAVVRDREGKNRLEFPVGNILYETGGWISHPRFSPSGKYLAFIEHPTLADDSGAVAVIDLQNTLTNKRRILSDKWISIQGLAWKAVGDELWFTAAKAGNARSVYSVSLNGKDERLVYRGIGSLTLQDLSGKNEALITVDKTRVRIAAHLSGETEVRDLSWHDWSLVRDISADGKIILFTEAGESAGSLYSAFIRKTDESEAIFLGEGSALALSPDGEYALVKLDKTLKELVLLSAKGGGVVKHLKPDRTEPLNYHPWACWFPDGKRILFAANQDDRGTKLYVQELDGEPECITPALEGVEISSPHSISPDNGLVAMIAPDHRICLYSIKGKSIVDYPKIKPNFLPVRWSDDGKYLFVRERGAMPAIVYRCELPGGELKPLYELMPKEKTGVHEILRVLVTPDAKSYAYSYTRDLSDLFIIEGLE